MLSKDVQYYVAVTYTPDGNGGVIEKQYVKNVGDSGFIWNNTVTRANWSVTANAAQGYFWLGHSGSNDNDTNIDFDEVRIWNGALSADALTLSVEASRRDDHRLLILRLGRARSPSGPK